MNRNSIIAIAIAASAFATGNAFAEDYNAHNPVFEGSRTRAEVQSELAQFKQSGKNPWSNSYNPIAGFRSDKSRSQVTADYIAARDIVDAFTGEDSGSGYLAGRPAAAGETRLAVRY